MKESSPAKGNSTGRWDWYAIAGSIAVAVIVLLAPAPEGLSSAGHRLVAITLLMVGLWLSQAVPLAVTAMLPLALYPLAGIQPAKQVSSAYFDSNVLLYLGGFIIALAIEKWNLHRRIAMHIVRIVGCGPKRIVLGFMLACAFLSMWISNTATTVMMLPIGLAMLAGLADIARGERTEENEAEPEAIQKFGIALLLGIAYSASLGGLATTVGTPTNVQMLSIWDKSEAFAQHGPLSMGTWMAAFVPLSVLMLLISWMLLTYGIPKIPGADNLGRGFFTERIKRLGKPSRSEWIVLAVFTTTACLWITRAELTVGTWAIMTGWGKPLTEWLVAHVGVSDAYLAGGKSPVDDSTVAMFMGLLLFFLPGNADREGQPQRLMDWHTVQHRMPWDILLLLGGGLAMAQAFQTTQLSEWLGNVAFAHAEGVPIWLLVLAVCFLMTFLTEFTSNVATVSTFIPIVLSAASQLQIDPRLLIVPATVSASCAFMLPIATPPNAIIFGSGRITIPQMARHGLLLNLIGVLLTTLITFLLLKPLLAG